MSSTTAKSPDEGSFVSGFLTGALLGAATHFFTKTAEGKAISAQFGHKWDEVRVLAQVNPETLAKKQDFADYIRRLREKITAIIAEELNIAVKKERAVRRTKQQATSEAAGPNKRKRLFRGL